MSTADTLQTAMRLHQTGQLQQAEELYRQILSLDPRNSDALHLLGLIAHQMGRSDVAVGFISQAIEIEGSQAIYHNNLGEANRALGRLAEAQANYHRAIWFDPAFGAAGGISHGLGEKERFAAGGGAEPLSADLSSSALGVTELPLLAQTEASLKQLAGDPAVRLSLGRLEVRGGARIVTTPISLEYGITRRLSVGVQVPIVQTRRVVQLRVNEDTTALANVGWVREGDRALAALQNQTLATALNSAAKQLDALINQCAANPAAAGCGPVNANPAGAAAARDLALAYATAVDALGVDVANALIAPRKGSALDIAIEARRAAVNQALQQFLGVDAGSSDAASASGAALPSGNAT